MRLTRFSFLLFIFFLFQSFSSVKLQPVHWGEVVPGVKTHLAIQDNVVALTLDACGSPHDGFDNDLIQFLIDEKIPATLFINARWIDKNLKTFIELAKNPLFEIENHGLKHKPCSINGKSIYTLKGTRNIQEIREEVEGNAKKIFKLTGQRPKFYRSGGAYYDELAVKVVESLGFQVAGFSVLGDKGASYTREQVKDALLHAQPCDIIILHMNHPESETAEGAKEALLDLKNRGVRFVKLSDQPLL